MNCAIKVLSRKRARHMPMWLLFLSPFWLICTGTVDLHFTRVNIFVFIVISFTIFVTFAIPLPPLVLSFLPPPSLWNFFPLFSHVSVGKLSKTEVFDRLRIFFFTEWSRGSKTVGYKENRMFSEPKLKPYPCTISRFSHFQTTKLRYMRLT